MWRRFFFLFKNFTEENTSFHKLDKLISDILLPNFIKILESHKPGSNSLGLRVRDLINADLSHTSYMIVTGNFDAYKSSLIRASSNYILSLEEIQNQYCAKRFHLS